MPEKFRPIFRTEKSKKQTSYFWFPRDWLRPEGERLLEMKRAGLSRLPTSMLAGCKFVLKHAGAVSYMYRAKASGSSNSIRCKFKFYLLFIKMSSGFKHQKTFCPFLQNPIIDRFNSRQNNDSFEKILFSTILGLPQ